MLIHSRKFRWKSIKMEVFFEVCSSSGRRQEQVPSLQSPVFSKTRTGNRERKTENQNVWLERSGNQTSRAGGGKACGSE